MTFQTAVSLKQAFGVPGEIFDNSPMRSQPYILNSASAAYNIVGSTAYTVSSEGVAAAGGTGNFAGILIQAKSYASSGTTAGGTLAPTLTLPNNAVGELASEGTFVVSLAQTANIAHFTGVIAATTGILTVSALTAGDTIVPGSLISGTGVPAGTIIGTQITGTTGLAGTYNTNITTAVSSTAMTSFNALNDANIGDQVLYNTTSGALTSQAPTTSFTGVIAITTGILTVTNIAEGSTIIEGSLLTGTGVPAGTRITGWTGTGTYGGNGTYNTNIVTAVSSTTMSTPNAAPSGYAIIKDAFVDRFSVASAGLAVISLSASGRTSVS